jgi:hypothetical protein
VSAHEQEASEDAPPEDKGEMVFVYRSDLEELFGWLLDKVFASDFDTMTPRQSEAWNALQADVGG